MTLKLKIHRNSHTHLKAAKADTQPKLSKKCACLTPMARIFKTRWRGFLIRALKTKSCPYKTLKRSLLENVVKVPKSHGAHF